MRHLFLFILTLAFLSTIAQDLHFSQFYSVPLNLNPANTGRFKEDYRLNAIYRKQWANINSAFETGAFGAELNFKGGKLNHDKIGIGLLFTNDQIGEGTITNNGFSLSAAYHKTVDAHKRHHVSLGVQGGYNIRSVNTTNFQFGNQYQNYQYNPALSNQENLENLQANFFDVNAGAAYSFTVSKKLTLSTGIAFNQLLRPTSSYLEEPGEKDDVSTRSVINAGADYKIKPFITLYPRILYMNQSNAQNFNIGAYAGFQVGHQKTTTLFGGAFYRGKDAAIALVGLGYKRAEIKFSYDFNVSQLSDVNGAENSGSGHVGAWEISLIFKGIINRGVPSEYTVPCGIF